ncbi:MAG: hypothetical protein ACK4ON_03235, partial [Bacteroidia bacterium]
SFTVTSAGNLGFLITPNNAFDDYDWAVYDVSNSSCADIFNMVPISCNYSGTAGATGANGGSGLNSQGAGGTRFNALIPVVVGQQLLLYISNFSASQFGYNLDFGLSTASIFDNVHPNVDQFLGINCGRNELKFKLSEAVLCDSIDLVNQNLSSCAIITGPGGPFVVDSVKGALCQAGNVTDTLIIYISPPITVGGTYTLNLYCGLRDACGNSGNGNLTFNVNPGVAVTITGNQTLCEGESTTLTASGATNFQWFPGGQTGPSILVTPTQTTTYKVVPTDGSCQGDTIPFVVTVFPAPSTNVTAPIAVCRLDTAFIQYSDPINPGMNFIWNFNGGIVLSGTGSGPYEVAWTSSGTKTITLNVRQGACFSDTTFSIVVLDRPVVDAGNDVMVCKGSSTVLQGLILNGNPNCTPTWSPSTGLDNPSSLTPLATPDTTTTYVLTADCDGCSPSVLDSVTITVIPRPTINFTQVQYAFCAGSAGVQLQTNANGSGNLLYEWIPQIGLSNPFISNPIANPSTTTLYSVIVRDQFGCPSDTAKALVVVDNVPVANAGSDIYLCKQSGQGEFLNGSATGSSGSYSFYWTPGTGLSDSTIANPYATPDTTTIYTLVVVSNLSGCSSFPTTLDTLSTVTVHVVGPPIADAGVDVSICPGDSIQIGEVPTGGGPNYTYLWQPSTGLSYSTAQLPLASPNFTTTYFLTVFSNGCQSIADSVVVTVNPRPTAAVVKNIEEICPGDSVVLQAFASFPVNGPFTNRWVPSIGLSDSTIANPLASPNDTTVYNVFIGYEGCEGSPAQVTVFVRPIPEIQADSTQSSTGLFICYGESIQIPAKSVSSYQPVSYQWMPIQGLSNPNILNPVANPTESVTYYLYATLGVCTVIDSVEITVSPEINPNILASKDTICQRDTLHLFAKGGVGSATFEWFPANSLNTNVGNFVIATPNETTTYYVVVKEGLCEDMDSFQVVVLTKPITNFAFSFPQGCQGMEVSFQDLSVNASQWTWD